MPTPAIQFSANERPSAWENTNNGRDSQMQRESLLMEDDSANALASPIYVK